MKKNLLFVILGFIGLILADCSPVGMTIRGSGGAEFLGNAINSITGLDLGPSTGVSIGNVTPFYLEVIILNSKFYVDPGGSINDSWYVEFDRSVLPIVVRAFNDKGRQFLVGITNRVLEIHRDRPTSWLIKDISFLNDSYGQSYGRVSPYPLRKMGSNQEVNIPRIAAKSTNIVEIINCSLHNIIVHQSQVRGNTSDISRIFTQNKAFEVYTLAPGEFYRTTSLDIFRRGQIIFQVSAADDGYQVGYSDPFAVDINPEGPRASQFLITSGMMNRY